MQLANAMSIPAKSLYFEREPIKLPQQLDNQMGHFLLSVLGFYSHKSKLLHGGQQLYQAIKEQCDDGAMLKGVHGTKGRSRQRIAGQWYMCSSCTALRTCSCGFFSKAHAHCADSLTSSLAALGKRGKAPLGKRPIVFVPTVVTEHRTEHRMEEHSHTGSWTGLPRSPFHPLQPLCSLEHGR